MPKSSSRRQPKSLVLVGMYILFLVVSFLVARADYVRGLRVAEAKGAASLLGSVRVIESVRTGNAIFADLFDKTGLIAWSYETAYLSENEKAPIVNYERASDSMVERTTAFWEMVRLAVQRVVFLFYWIPVLIPFVFAATVDGVISREIRKWRFQFTSTTIYNQARKAIGVIAFGVFLLPVLPIRLPVMVYPLAIILITLMLWAAIANMQKRI